MADNNVEYTNIDKSEDIMDATFDTLVGRLDKSKESLDTFFSDIDTRILRYKSDVFNKLVNQMDELEEDKQDLREGQDYYNHAYQGYRSAKQAASDINTATKLGDITTPAITDAVNTLDVTKNLLDENKKDDNNDGKKTQDVKDEDFKDADDKDKKKNTKNVEDPEKASFADSDKAKSNTNIPVVKAVTSTVTPLKELGEEVAAKEDLTASIMDGVEDAENGLLDAIENGPTRFKKQISPYSGNVGVTNTTNKATAGIIAAASVAAGGAAAGGGVLLGKRLDVIKFTPEDWKALGTDYQTVIEKLFKKVGFSNEEIETFKTSKFKIATAELKEHVKKIDKAKINNPQFEDDFLKLYDYSMIDNNGRVIDYLLFITMIIDGRNSIDEYNMYSIINQGLDGPDDADFFYTGIDMDDYIDDTEDEEIQMLNDPTTEPIENNEGSPKAPIETKEWLQGIGMEE